MIARGLAPMVVLATLATVTGLVGCEPEPAVFFRVTLDVQGAGTVRVVFADDDDDDDDVDDSVCSDGRRCELRVRSDTLLSAQARPGNNEVFVRFEGDCGGLSGVADVVVTRDIACTAVFAPDPVLIAEGPRLSLDVLGPGALITLPAQLDCHGTDVARDACATQFIDGTIVTVQAVADAGAAFVGFTGDCDSFDTIAEVSMNGDRTCGATFIESDVLFPIRIEVIDGDHGVGGTVTSSPAGLRCGDLGTACLVEFASGTLLTITATANPGSEFVRWGHACEGVFENAFEFEVNFALSCSAEFRRVFRVDIVGEGAVVSDDDSCDAGFAPCTFDVVPTTLTAIPDVGQRFVSWSGGCSGTATTVTVDPRQISCTARFEPIPPQIEVTIIGPGRVTAANNDPIDCPGDCVSLGAISGPAVEPGPGAWVCPIGYFGTDDGCDCGCGLPDPDCLTAAASACGYCSAGCASSCDDIAPTQNHLCIVDTPLPSVTLVAEPDDHGVFVGWSGDCFGSTPRLPVIIDEVLACQANFARNLIVETTGPGSVTVGPTTCRTSCETTTIPATITARPDSSARLVRWEGDCARSDTPLTIDVAADVGLCRAVFETTPPRLLLAVDGPGTIAGLGADCASGCTSDGGATSLIAELVATPDAGATFVGWSGACSGALTAVRVTVPVAEVRSCAARFLAGYGLEIVTAHSDVLLGGATAIDPAGEVLSFIDDDGQVARLDVATGALGSFINPRAANVTHTVTGLVDDGAGQLLLLGRAGADHRAFVFAADGLRATLNAPHTAPLTTGALGVGADDDVVCTADASGRIKVWSRATGLVQRTLVAHDLTPVLAVAVTAGRVLSVGGDGAVALRSTTSSAVLDADSPLGGPATAAAIDGGRVVLADGFGGLAVIDADLAAGTFGAARLATMPGAVSSLAVSGDVAVAIVDGRALRVDIATLQAAPLTVADAARAHAGRSALVVVSAVSATRFAPDGAGPRRFDAELGRNLGGVVVSDDNAVAFDLVSDRLLAVSDELVVSGPGRAAVAAAAHAGTIYLASALGGVEAVVQATGAIRRVTPAIDDVTTIAVSPNGELIAGVLASGASDIAIYEAAIGEVFRTLSNNGGVVTNVAFLDDNHLVIARDTGSAGRVAVLRISDNAVVADVALALEPRALTIRGVTLAIGGRSGVSGRVVLVDATTKTALIAGAPMDVLAPVVDLAIVSDDVVLVADAAALHALDVVNRAVRGSAAQSGVVRAVVAVTGPDDHDIWLTTTTGVARWRLRR